MNQRDALATMSESNNVDQLQRMHPSLHATFVALPPAGVALTPEQIRAIFGGDIRALRDLAELAYQSDETKAE